MQSPNKSYQPQVDEIRAAAALLVFFFHSVILGYWASGMTGWPPTANPLVAVLLEGHSGVALFMVLSGYILAVGSLDRDISYRRFLLNRVLRIFPLMTFVTFFAIAGNSDLQLHNVLAPFLLLQNIQSIALVDRTNLIGTVWTIAIEFQFYLIAPFLFRSVRKDGIVRFILPLMLLVVVLRLFTMLPDLGSPEKLWAIPYFSIAGRLNQFLFGIAIAALLPKIRFRHPRLSGSAILVAGLAAMALLSLALNRGGGQYIWQDWRFVQQELEGLFWAMAIAGYILADPLRSLPLLRKGAIALGTISFSFYLLHWPVVTTAWKLLPTLGISSGTPAILFLIAAGFILPVVTVLSALSYWVIERPFLAKRLRYVE